MGTDTQGLVCTAEDAPRLQVERGALAQRLARAHECLRTHQHDIWHQYCIPPERKALDAAVLIPLVSRGEGVQVLFTQRTPHLNAHAGQISFPGGGVEAHDRHREDTALRETEEEIGLPRSRIEVLGSLPDYEIQSGYRVAPVVGWITPPYVIKPDPFEVHDVFEAPLAHFLCARNYQRRSYVVDGLERRYLAIPFGGRYIWGATAGMLYTLYQLLRE